jgi:hypothetical protein
LASAGIHIRVNLGISALEVQKKYLLLSDLTDSVLREQSHVRKTYFNMTLIIYQMLPSFGIFARERTCSG